MVPEDMRSMFFYTSHAYEVNLVNKKLITINKPTRSFKPHPISRPSFPSLGLDCQMSD